MDKKAIISIFVVVCALTIVSVSYVMLTDPFSESRDVSMGDYAPADYTEPLLILDLDSLEVTPYSADSALEEDDAFMLFGIDITDRDIIESYSGLVKRHAEDGHPIVVIDSSVNVFQGLEYDHPLEFDHDAFINAMVIRDGISYCYSGTSYDNGLALENMAYWLDFPWKFGAKIEASDNWTTAMVSAVEYESTATGMFRMVTTYGWSGPSEAMGSINGYIHNREAYGYYAITTLMGQGGSSHMMECRAVSTVGSQSSISLMDYTPGYNDLEGTNYKLGFGLGFSATTTCSDWNNGSDMGEDVSDFTFTFLKSDRGYNACAMGTEYLVMDLPENPNMVFSGKQDLTVMFEDGLSRTILHVDTVRTVMP